VPGVKQAALGPAVVSTVVSAAGNSGPLTAPYGATQVAVIPAVTAYTSGTITYEVQWSFDGVNFFSADPKDTFANITAVNPGVVKVVAVKAPYYRVTWTTGAYTHNLQHGPVTTSEWTSTPSPFGYEQGAGSLSGPTIGIIGSTTQSATFAQATPATYSAITAVPQVAGVSAGRMALKLNITANTWTASPQFEILWSFTGLPYNASSNPTPLLHADPQDLWATSTGATTTIKEVVVKAPFFAIAQTVGTPGSATYTVDAIPSAL
jgi:hypothetical protein